MISIEDIQEVAKVLGKKGRLNKDGEPIKTTNKETWKAFERKVSVDFGTTRTPLSGMVKTITNSDTLHPKIYVECKYRNDDYSFWESFEETREKHPDKVIVLCIYPKDRAMVHLYYAPDFFKRIETSEPIYLIVNKTYKGVCTLFEQTIERSEIEKKLPVVALKKKNGKGYLIGINPKYFNELQKVLKKSKNG